MRIYSGIVLHVMLVSAFLAPLVTERDTTTALHVYLAATLLWWSLGRRMGG